MNILPFFAPDALSGFEYLQDISFAPHFVGKIWKGGKRTKSQRERSNRRKAKRK